jgi:hypothetical protein
VAYSCRGRCFCPSCHEKRALEKAGWVAEHVCAEVPHRQFVFTIPKRLRIYLRFDRRLLGELCRAAARTVVTVYRSASGRPDAVPGVVEAIQTFGQLIHAHPHIHALVSDFLAEVTQHIPDPGAHLGRYYGWYSNKSRGQQAKTLPPAAAGTGLPARPPTARQARKGWAALIKQIYETDPLLCPRCGSTMRMIAFIERHQTEVIEKIPTWDRSASGRNFLLSKHPWHTTLSAAQKSKFLLASQRSHSSAACRVTMGTYPASNPGGGLTIKAGSISASLPIPEGAR